MAKYSFTADELTILANEIIADPTYEQLLCDPASISFSSTNTISSVNCPAATSLNVSSSAPLIDEELTADISDSTDNNNNIGCPASLNVSLSAPLIDEELTLSFSDSNHYNNNNSIPKQIYSVSQSIRLSTNTSINIDLSNCISPIPKRGKSKKLKKSKRRKSKKFKKNKKINKRSKSSLFIKQSKKKTDKNNPKIYAKTDMDLYNNKIWKLKDLIREIFSLNSDISERARNVLILCHNSFISSCNLFGEFRRIFCMNISEMTYTMFKFENVKSQSDTIWFIRLKITECIIYWIKNYWVDDFSLNNELQKQIELFKSDIKRIENEQNANELINLINNTLQFIINENNNLNIKTIKKTPIISIEKRFSNLTKLEMCNNSNFELMEFDPINIAQQLTLLDNKIFNKIESRECIQQKWKSKNKNMKAPNILDMIAQFNDINKWVQISILKANTVKNRKRILKKMIIMATFFMENNNLSSLCAFYSALMSKNIRSLNKTWKLLSNKKLKEFENIQQLFGWKMNKFKLMHNKLESPAIPHMGIILEKLFQIEEVYKKSNQIINSIDGIIDCGKMMLLYKQINNVKKLQVKRYEYEPDLLIQKLLITELQLNDQLDQNVLDKSAKCLANSEQLL